MALDTVRRIATPEGCELELHVAGPLCRVRAWLIDALIRVGCWFALAITLTFAGQLGVGFFMVAAFLLEWFYPVLFEVLMGGQTPGKRVCELVVLQDDGRPVGWNASFIRNTVRFVDFMPLFYAVGFVSCVLTRDSKRLGDLAAGTVVVYGPPRANRKKKEWSEIEEKGVEAPPQPLAYEEQKALIEYRQRAGLLTEARALELAELVQPLTGEGDPVRSQRRLLRIGNFLLGRQ
jgi:uncharacterized RDD family membrane protein YckC